MSVPRPKSNGYEKLAQLMSKHSEVATFQRFNFINTLNILYLQAELVHLEEELRDSMKADLEVQELEPESDGYCRESSSIRGDERCIVEERKVVNHQSGSWLEKGPKVDAEVRSITSSSLLRANLELPIDEKLESTRDWWYLSTMEGSPTWQIMLRTREKLKEYNEAVHRHTTLKAQPSPNSASLSFLRRWFKDPKMGNFPLLGRDRNVWDASPASSLLAVQPRNSPDPLGRLFLTKVFIWWHHLIGHHFKTPKSLSTDEEETTTYFEYTDRRVLKVANIVGTLISSSLLVGSVVALYFVDSMLARLGIVAALTQVFGLVLVLVTNATKAEVFAATAAFMAVQVVFIGSNSPPNSPSG